MIEPSKFIATTRIRYLEYFWFMIPSGSKIIEKFIHQCIQMVIGLRDDTIFLRDTRL